MHRKDNPNPLWTKNFSILTLGSVVSMLGNSLSGFALSLLVLDYTQSSFYYAVYIIMFTLPQIVMPIISGAILDRFSRRRTIYTLDFISSLLYLAAATVLGMGYFSFGVLAVFCFLLGSVQSIYLVAYQSFYPMLVAEENYSKAYSVSSILETLSAMMIPVSALVYNLVGMVPLLAVNALCFFVAASMETRIDAREDYVLDRGSDDSRSPAVILADIKEGFKYLISEKGLLMIALYFAFYAMSGGASSVITLPYFKAAFTGGEYVYMLVWGTAEVGRIISGMVLYRVKLPSRRRYSLAMTAYLVSAISEGFYLYCGIPVMMVACFAIGSLGIVSYTIRTAATQSYVPHEKKGRFNGAFNMLSTSGNLIGQAAAGALTLILPPRLVLMGFCMVNAVAALVFIGGNRRAVSDIYGREPQAEDEI